MAPRPFRFLHSQYEILVHDLTRQDLNKMLSEDMRGMYEFYARSMKSVEGEPHRFKRMIKFIWHLFVAFLLKLTPARRFFYMIAIVFFLVALFQDKIVSAAYSFIIINVLLAMELADKLVTKDELTVARDIQLSLQPTHISSLIGFEIAVYSDVAKQVGGDYFDILSLIDGNKLLVVGDVSGKGISSALYVVKVQTALQLLANETSDPAELLVRLNAHIYGQLKRNYFLTLFVAKVRPDGDIQLCRAGHPPALLYRSAEKAISWLQPNGMAIGIMPSSDGRVDPNTNKNTDFRNALEMENVQLATGDILFMYTDGVSESVDKNGKEFGLDRIATLIKSFATESPENLRQRIVADLAAHQGSAELRDDITFVLLKRS